MNGKLKLAAACAALALGTTGAFANEKVIFGTNWLAQAEHGGYYQALADGDYAACGVDLTIQQGGPQVAGRPLLLAGKIDFYMGGNMQQAFDAVAQGIPLRVVAAHFQKEPQVMMSRNRSSRAMCPPSRSRWRRQAASCRTSSCSRTTATAPIRPRSRRCRIRSTSGRKWCSASSMPRRRAGTNISTATTRPPTR